MSTAASAPPASTPLRCELAGPNYAYELTLVPLGGLTLRVEEGDVHDAAVFLTPAQIVELRADLANALLVLQPIAVIGTGITTTPGRALLEHLRQVFIALVELDKTRSGEVDALCAVIVQHLRSWRPFVLRAEATPGSSSVADPVHGCGCEQEPHTCDLDEDERAEMLADASESSHG